MNNEDILNILQMFAGRTPAVESVNNVTITNIESPATDVYCLTVPTGAFVIKHNDKVSVTGNCHCSSMTKLFKTFLSEHKDVWDDELKSEIYSICETMVKLEDAFIDLAFGVCGGTMRNLTAAEVKQYIRYIADRRLISAGMKGIFKVKKNPLPWVEEMVGAPTHGNFFESKVTDYAKGALSGSWDDVWAT
jgi:ribonucleotide reductase beta subunit family protein with ferritin-like domain